MTLPARSLPDAATPDQPDPESPEERELPFPLTFVAVVGVSALVIILCVLGAAASGLFGLLGGVSDAEPISPTATVEIPPVRPPGSQFGDGQSIVGVDMVKGTYQTLVPADSPGCAWEHAASADGTMSSVISSGTANVGETLFLTLTKDEQIVRSDGCGVWHRTA